jgi:hypothetical protein
MKKKLFKLLTPENMSDDLIGYRVTMGLRDIDKATTQGNIVKYDDKHLYISVGAKTIKSTYQPQNVVLCVYQFEKEVQFVSEHEFNRLEKEANEQEREKTNSKPKKKKSSSKPKTQKEVMEMFYDENEK